MTREDIEKAVKDEFDQIIVIEVEPSRLVDFVVERVNATLIELARIAAFSDIVPFEARGHIANFIAGNKIE